MQTKPKHQPSELLDRLPPQNLDAEKGVLGSILLVPDVCDEVTLIVRPDDFYADAHQRLYRQLLAMHNDGKRIDITLLLERLRKTSELEACGGPAAIAEIISSVPTAANAAYYAQIVRDKAMLRALIEAGTDILRDAYEDTKEPRELVSAAEERVFAIEDRRSDAGAIESRDLIVEAFARIDARMDRTEGVGVPTGFTDLDNMMGGLHESEFIVLAARPSMGKTALATNIAENVSIRASVPTLFVSLEMARVELAQRMLCSQARVDGNKMRSGFLSKDDRQRLIEASLPIGHAPLFIDDTPTRTVTEIAACARRLKRKSGLGLIVIDYLQLIQPDDPRDVRQEQVAKMARRLKGLARELKVPVLCLAQLNRQADSGKEGHRPRLSQLRESGAIEQDADVVMFVHREEYYCNTREEAQELGLCGKAEIIVAKQRNGPTGDVKVAWVAQYMRFESLSTEQRQTQQYDEFAEFAQ